MTSASMLLGCEPGWQPWSRAISDPQTLSELDQPSRAHVGPPVSAFGQGAEPGWLKPVQTRIRQLSELRYDWDHHGGARINREVLFFAWHVIARRSKMIPRHRPSYRFPMAACRSNGTRRRSTSKSKLRHLFASMCGIVTPKEVRSLKTTFNKILASSMTLYAGCRSNRTEREIPALAHGAAGCRSNRTEREIPALAHGAAGTGFSWQNSAV
jgi:hypothetical protein